MEVTGPRCGLQFYPGECRGTVYKGFVYESDAGARVVRLETTATASGPSRLANHYNGGGAFIDADQYAEQGVTVLGRYPSDDEDVGQVDSNRTYASQAAIVHCKVGSGQALLFGTHPEFSLLPDSRPVQLTGAPQTLSSAGPTGSQIGSPIDAKAQADAHRAELIAEDEQRKIFLARCLQSLGLDVKVPSSSQNEFTESQKASSADLASQSKLSHLTIAGPRSTLDSCVKSLSELSAPAASSSKLPESDSQHLLSIKDTNDAFHLYSSASGLGHKCDELSYSDYAASDTGEVDLHAVPKHVFLSATEDGGDTTSSNRHWDTAAYLAALDASRRIGGQAPGSSDPELGHIIQYGERVTSTQTMLDKNPKMMARLPTGFVSFATHQISGRGRGGNSWISPLGCLQFSLLLHIPSAESRYAALGNSPMVVGPKLVFVQYLAGLAIVDAIRTGLGPEYAAVGRRVRLKWPNDVYAEVSGDNPLRKGTFQHLGKTWAKMGGILVNSQYLNGRWSLVVGCGVNCLNAQPTTSLSALIHEENAQRSAGGSRQPPLAPVSQECLAGAILASFERIWSHFLTAGHWDQELAQAYSSAWLHGDQVTTLTTVDPHVQVRIVGISPDSGTLRAVPVGEPGGAGGAYGGLTSQDAQSWSSTAGGHSSSFMRSGASSPAPWWELQPDGNSFDMLSNLIKTKT